MTCSLSIPQFGLRKVPVIDFSRLACPRTALPRILAAHIARLCRFAPSLCQLKLSRSQAALDSWTSLIALGRFFASKASKDDEPEQEPTLSMKQRCPPGSRVGVQYPAAPAVQPVNGPLAKQAVMPSRHKLLNSLRELAYRYKKKA